MKVLRNGKREPSDEELRAAALQFVRKISGFRQPSRQNEAAFERAVEEVTAAGRRLFDGLSVPRPR
ncbi:MAG: DUF2277 domain-containing protein [Candidatus Xenobia bacterium]